MREKYGLHHASTDDLVRIRQGIAESTELIKKRTENI